MISAYVGNLCETLTTLFQISFSEEDRSQLASEFSRLRSPSDEDLGQCVLLECFESQKDGTLLTAELILRMTHRIRERIRRRAIRERGIDSNSLPFLAAKNVAPFSDDVLTALSAFAMLTPEELLVAEQLLIGKTPKVIAEECGLSLATVYRRRASVAAAIKADTRG